MSIIEIILLSIGLSMDACAVSICKGISIKKLSIKKMLTIGIYFGIFQALMPLLGYFLSINFENVVVSIDHYIALFLLSFIGINMIKESFNNKETLSDDLSFKTMIILAIATSIDALAVGITFAFLDVNLYLAIFLIGIITFTFSVVGVNLGNRFGTKYGSKAELIGGIILILLGIKILLEHLNVI